MPYAITCKVNNQKFYVSNYMYYRPDGYGERCVVVWTDLLRHARLWERKRTISIQHLRQLIEAKAVDILDGPDGTDEENEAAATARVSYVQPNKLKRVWQSQE